MKEAFSNYLNAIQYNKICRYWRFINEASYNLDNFDYSRYMSYQDYSDDEETILNCINNNTKLDRSLEKLKGKLTYYQEEYERYINSIGFELGNRTYDEILFNLLNDGIILD
jgi:hypothetical protein